jgi:hypothetical protein
MDDRRFDQMTKAFSGATGSRRETLGLAMGSAAAAVLGFLGVEEAAVAQRRNNDDRNRRRRNRDRDRDRDKVKKLCHCPDATGQNCKTKKLNAKKIDRHLNKHPNDYKGKCAKPATACTDINNPCRTNQGGACCAGVCCFDIRTAVPNDGVCPPRDANCCGLNFTGGYCTTTYPLCCGEDACCKTGEVCCANQIRPSGYCCPAGQVCDFNRPSGCAAAQTATTQAASESVVGTFAPRGRAGNSRR